ncbi:LRR receptor-like serine/threonine-protein kinase [Carex littledalei]|uniref:LRR receptor-like serine/threonine-protein kinase n=1 Tax=Carex littledalei TaxID=544730 RepID=A0A833QM72_9POAL|nr:LRR receptor-like serine/threonine-protein kinase [Carex littledalei]
MITYPAKWLNIYIGTSDRVRYKDSVWDTQWPKPHRLPSSNPIVHPAPHGEPLVHLKTLRYTKTELENITQNFRQEIGRGGFGGVFAGTLPDKKGTRVAVKKLSDSAGQGTDEFVTEVENLAMLNHRNLVSLIGYCEDVDCLALVYEYMPQGSLEDHLRGKKSPEKALSWKERIRIAFETAEGLHYLHKDCSITFIHRDVKSSNILLTEDLTAKVSDLGISKALSNQKTEKVATKVCGTMGYMDPEYGVTGFLTQKSDVYSFGVILLEIITGQRPGPGGLEGVILVERVRQKMAEQNGNIESIIDAQLRGDYGIDSMWSVFELARKCTHDEPEPRPTMEFVVTELKNALKMEDGRLKEGQNNQSTRTRGSNINYNVTEIANQNFRIALETNDQGPDMR